MNRLEIQPSQVFFPNSAEPKSTKRENHIFVDQASSVSPTLLFHLETLIRNTLCQCETVFDENVDIGCNGVI